MQLTDRTLSVSVGELVSDMADLSCGVPQGSVLGPNLFSLYMLPLRQTISSFSNISCHLNAEDIQLYFSFKPDELDRLSVLNCLNANRNWMMNNFLQWKADKTEVLIIAPDNLHNLLSGRTLLPYPRSSVLYLGVIFDQSVLMLVVGC